MPPRRSRRRRGQIRAELRDDRVVPAPVPPSNVCAAEFRDNPSNRRTERPRSQIPESSAWWHRQAKELATPLVSPASACTRNNRSNAVCGGTRAEGAITDDREGGLMQEMVTISRRLICSHRARVRCVAFVFRSLFRATAEVITTCPRNSWPWCVEDLSPARTPKRS